MATIDDKDVEMTGYGVVELNGDVASGEVKDGNRDDQEMAYYGKKQQLKVRTRGYRNPKSFAPS